MCICASCICTCVHLCICVPVHVYMCASIHVYICTCVHGETRSQCCLFLSSLHIWNRLFFTEPEAHRLARLASWQESRISRVPPAPRNRLQMCATMPSFYVAAGNLNSVPQICIASTLPNAVSPAPDFYILFWRFGLLLFTFQVSVWKDHKELRTTTLHTNPN